MYNKAIVAVIMSVIALIEEFYGKQLGISEEWVLTTIAILTPVLVWLVPNRNLF